MDNPTVRIVINYIIASAVVLAAAFLKISMSTVWENESPFLLFFAAIFLATWQGGFRCGVFATVLSVAFGSYYFIVPFHIFSSSFNDILSLCIFAIESILVAWMTDSLLRAKDQLSKSLENEKIYSTQLSRSVSQIELLNERLQLAMTETHHRVKNSLQTISALLGMQVIGGRSITAQEVKKIISQVHGIGVLHDVLTEKSGGLNPSKTVSAKRVMEKIVPLLKQSVGDKAINFHIDDGLIDARQASSLAVIVNELVGNSIKHGGKQVEVSLVQKGANLVLQVEDDGRGFPQDFNVSVHANTGLRLIQKLSESDFNCTPVYGGEGKGGCVTIHIPTKQENQNESYQYKEKETVSH